MPQIYGTFTADGSSAELTAQRLDFCVGDSSSDFGGGTVTLEVKQNDQFGWTPAQTFTEASADTTINAKGFKYRLTLSGATAPSINYSLVW